MLALLAHPDGIGDAVGADRPAGRGCGVPGCGRGRCPAAADLRTLARQLHRVRRQLSRELAEPSRPGRHVRLTAGRLAYVDLLVQACGILRIPTSLPAARGVVRDLEVLRVEAALAGAGLAT